MDIKAKREADILAAACKVIRMRGYHNMRMAEIAKEADISYGLVYHYYKSKSALFDAILDKWWSSMNEMIDDDLQKNGSIEEKLGAIVDFFIEQYREQPDLVHIFITEVSRSTANLTPERLDAFRHWIQRTERLISKAQSRGELRQDIKSSYMTTFFLGGLETLVSTMVLDGRPIRNKAQKERMVNNMLEQFFNGARPLD